MTSTQDLPTSSAMDAGATSEMSGPHGETPPRRLIVPRERRSRRVIVFAALFVAGLVPAIALVLVVMLAVRSFTSFPAAGESGLLLAFGATLGLAGVGTVTVWVVAQMDARRRLLAAMHGRPPDGRDSYHRRLLDIVEELRLATGEHAVACVVAPALGMNAYAFSDMHGGAVVGVTEGALSRLSRPQLQAVVAHEFAHIVSGAGRTATLACLLFGMLADDERVVDGGLDVSPGRAGASVLEGGRAVGSALTAGMHALARVLSALINGILSREREFEADAAAAHYVGDPVTLALALRSIDLHPVGAGYIPPGLSALCIRGAEAGAGWVDRRAATHPPMAARIESLLVLANVSYAQFEAQAARMERAGAGREHATWEGGAAASAFAPASTAGPHRPGVPTGACPSCGSPLLAERYEGAPVRRCRSCRGHFVESDAVGRIMARRTACFSPEQVRLADDLSDRGDRLRRTAVLARFRPKGPSRTCPGCGAAMMHRHYSYDDAIEIDYCSPCDAYWLDRDELEVLQLLAERRLG